VLEDGLTTIFRGEKMQITLSERVKIFLKTSSRDERERLDAWFEYLRNWDEDPYAKSQSVLLNVQGQSMYLFRTSTGLYIFYTVDIQNKIVHVTDIAARETILAVGGGLTGES
jgi:mRNA-degrading endonuclease RelE of RelBE toxin-antitoxin system